MMIQGSDQGETIHLVIYDANSILHVNSRRMGEPMKKAILDGFDLYKRTRCILIHTNPKSVIPDPMDLLINQCLYPLPDHHSDQCLITTLCCSS